MKRLTEYYKAEEKIIKDIEKVINTNKQLIKKIKIKRSEKDN